MAMITRTTQPGFRMEVRLAFMFLRVLSLLSQYGLAAINDIDTRGDLTIGQPFNLTI